jgi:hypothetical protein
VAGRYLGTLCGSGSNGHVACLRLFESFSFLSFQKRNPFLLGAQLSLQAGDLIPP